MVESKSNPVTASSPWNVPNALSALRLILAIVVCILIEWDRYVPAAVVFIVAASTDWIDGWWARKFHQVTKLGRILDPFVDKIIICGAMIAIVGETRSPIPAWVATVIVGRELLVTSLRGMIEGQGGDFSAKQLGKWKMLAQCVAIVAALWELNATPVPDWLYWTTRISLGIAVLLTVVSAMEYVWLVIRGSQTKTGSPP